MELTGLKIDGFGVWNNLRYDDFSSGITAVYGRNEAGKTTLMHFIRSVLYGYSPARRQRFLPPHYGGRPGGWLQINRADGPLRLERYADLDTKNGHLTISDANGTLPIETTLRSVLVDVDEATYNNVYAIGLREIQELGTLSDTDAARWLYSLTTGLDRVLLLDVVRELNTSRERLISRDGHASLMTELLNRRAQLQDEIDQRVIQGRRWSQVTIKLQEIDAEIERLESDRNRLEYRARTIEIAIQVKPKWLQRMDLDRQLAAYHGRIRLPDDAIQQLDQLNQEIESHERQQEVLKRQRHVLREEIDSLGINETLVRSIARIEALGEQRDWLEALERQQSALKDELEIIQSQLANEHDRLGFDLQSIHLDKKKVPDLSEGLINSLRPHAKAVRAAREQLAVAQREADSKQATAEEYRAQLISAMPESAQTALPTDLEQAGELVANLRKRLHVNERLEQAQRHEVELQQQNHELLDRQEAPLWTAAALALLLFAGLAFLAYGLLAPSFAAKGFGTAALVCFFGWHLFKYLIEDQISQRREECQRQFSLARNQIDLAMEEKRELDNLLGPINGSVVVQLQAAERHLSQLEKLLPIETRRREAQLEADTAARRVAAAERDLENAMTSWQNKLKNLGLPKDLTPSDIRAVASRFEQVTDLRIRVERRRSDAEQRCQEHTALCKRIRNLAEEVGLLLPDATPIAQLEHLQSHVRQHRMRVEERDRLRRKEKDLKETESRHARSATALRNRRELMFVQAAAGDETAYRVLFREQEQADTIRNEKSTVGREITAAIGSHAPEQEIMDLLDPESIGLLDRWWEEAASQLETVEKHLKDIVATRGALQQELSQLTLDRSLAERQLHLAAVEEQIKRAIAQWRNRAAASIILDEVRTRYEKERQPETLIAASEHFKRLTGGAYQRIWTPLGKELLFVDNAQGESLAIEVLSRGTREQLFLSLRLALVALLARRGIRLPMILDDVLVNFDENRARQAVNLLNEFAEMGHQVLVFTCHEHIYQMFRDLDLATWRLPDHFGAVQQSAPTSHNGQPENVPSVAAIDTRYEYIEESEDRTVPIQSIPAETPIQSPAPQPKPKRSPKSKRTPRRKPVNVLPPTPIPEIKIEPADPPMVEPHDSEDEWIRIGPQVRRRDRVDRRTIREISPKYDDRLFETESMASHALRTGVEKRLYRDDDIKEKEIEEDLFLEGNEAALDDAFEDVEDEDEEDDDEDIDPELDALEEDQDDDREDVEDEEDRDDDVEEDDVEEEEEEEEEDDYEEDEEEDEEDEEEEDDEEEDDEEDGDEDDGNEDENEDGVEDEEEGDEEDESDRGEDEDDEDDGSVAA